MTVAHFALIGAIAGSLPCFTLRFREILAAASLGALCGTTLIVLAAPPLSLFALPFWSWLGLSALPGIAVAVVRFPSLEPNDQERLIDYSTFCLLSFPLCFLLIAFSLPYVADSLDNLKSSIVEYL